MSRIVWPEKSLAQLVRKLAEPQNGNGKHETKSVPVVNYPPELFWDSALNGPALTAQSIRGFNAYAISALAYACMRYRSTKFIEAPLWVAEENKDGADTWVKDSPLSELLERPNPDMEMSDLLEITSLYMDTDGRCLWVKSRDRGKRVGALYPFPSSDFAASSANGQMYGRFTVMTASGKKDYAPDDVIFFKNVDPRNPLNGLGPLSAALSHLNISEEMRLAITAALRNTIMPGAAVFVEGMDDEADRQRFKAEVNANFAGAQNKGKLMVLENVQKDGFKLFERSLKEMDLGPIQQDIEAAVCSCFQVHPAVIGTKLGLTANSGLADTIKPATELFYDMFLFPTWNKFERTLTRSLLREVDDNPMHRLKFVTDGVRFLKDDLGERTTEASAAQGYWTLNEQRTHTGKPALDPRDPRGDEITSKVAPAVATATATEPAKVSKNTAEYPTGKEEAAEKADSIATQVKADARNRLWRRFDVKARRQERPYEDEAQKQFEHERADVYKRLSGSSDATINAALDKIRAAYTRKDGQYHAEWLKRYESLISETVRVAGEDLGAELGFDFNLENPRVQVAIMNRTNHLAGNVTTTTYDQIKETVKTSRSDGEGIGVLAKRIRDDVFGGEITKARATMIARTETIGALNQGEAVAAAESGIIRSKSWLSQGDARVRDGHAIDDETVPLDGFFSNGLEYPGDERGDAANVINCRCTVLYSDEAIT